MRTINLITSAKSLPLKVTFTGSRDCDLVYLGAMMSLPQTIAPRRAEAQPGEQTHLWAGGVGCTPAEVAKSGESCPPEFRLFGPQLTLMRGPTQSSDIRGHAWLPHGDRRRRWPILPASFIFRDTHTLMHPDYLLT